MGRQRSRARRLDELKEAIDGAHGFWRLDTLRWAVGAALKEPAPKGRPADIANHGLMVTRAGRECASEHAYTRAYARETLPETWFGMTAVSATQAMSALDGELRRAADTLDQAGATLTALAASITAAQARDALGRGPLWHAKQILDHMATPVFDHVARPVFDVARPVFDHVARPVFDHDGDQLMLAHREAREGIAHLAAAAHIAEDAGRLAARRLGELSTVARGARLNTRSLTDLDKLVLADAAVPPGAPASGSSAGPAAAPAVPSGLGLHDHNLILTAAAAGRAADRMEQMSPEDRRRFDALLSEARSAQERAYLVQALAAGHSLTEVEAFGRKIHGHGDDPAWLRDRLTPAFTQLDQGRAGTAVSVGFDGRRWTQGQQPTCVAASTVLARARVDPIYALDITTGGHPDDPRSDNGEAFAKRLMDEQHRVYGEGRSFLEDWLGTDGIGDGGTQDVVNAELRGPTGLRFELVDVNSADERRNALPDIEHSVDQGVPVPFGVTDDGRSHEMVVIGHEGDMLQIYNPWGYTMWVSEDAFVDGHFDLVGPGVPATFDDVTLPKR